MWKYSFLTTKNKEMKIISTQQVHEEVSKTIFHNLIMFLYPQGLDIIDLMKVLTIDFI